MPHDNQICAYNRCAYTFLHTSATEWRYATSQSGRAIGSYPITTRRGLQGPKAERGCFPQISPDIRQCFIIWVSPKISCRLVVRRVGLLLRYTSVIVPIAGRSRRVRRSLTLPLWFPLSHVPSWLKLSVSQLVFVPRRYICITKTTAWHHSLFPVFTNWSADVIASIYMVSTSGYHPSTPIQAMSLNGITRFEQWLHTAVVNTYLITLHYLLYHILSLLSRPKIIIICNRLCGRPFLCYKSCRYLLHRPSQGDIVRAHLFIRPNGGEIYLVFIGQCVNQVIVQ